MEHPTGEGIAIGGFRVELNENDLLDREKLSETRLDWKQTLLNQQTKDNNN